MIEYFEGAGWAVTQWGTSCNPPVSKWGTSCNPPVSQWGTSCSPPVSQWWTSCSPPVSQWWTSCSRPVSQWGTSCSPPVADQLSEHDIYSKTRFQTTHLLKLMRLQLKCTVYVWHVKYIYVFFCELAWHTCSTESDVNINVCTKFAYTCIAILVVYLGIAYPWISEFFWS